MRYARRPITRTMITEHVWDIHFDSISNVVDVHINSLRNKIDKGFSAALIHRSRGGLHAFGQGTMKPFESSQTDVSICRGVHGNAERLYIATYYLLDNELETYLNQELLDRAAGLKGYIDFEDEVPYSCSTPAMRKSRSS
jgi:hypothetical protein